MISRYIITTPANTLETAKQKTVLTIPRGVIHQIDILFPPGPAGLTHIHFNRGIFQIWPSNPESSFAADNDKISFREHYEVMSRPFQLEAFTWNEDDTFAHSIIVRIGVLARKFVLRRLI